MRAIIIDAKQRQIREIEVNGTLACLQAAVGGLIEEAFMTGLPDVLFVNEEGLINGTKYGFILEGAMQPLIGDGIIIGHDGRGGLVDAKVSLDAILLRRWL